MERDAGLHALAAAKIDAWAGLPPDVTLEVIRISLPVVPDMSGHGRLGASGRSFAWVAAEASAYEGGLRIYVDDDDRVVLVDGRDPVTDSGAPLIAPDLGDPDAVLDTTIGPVMVTGGERVYSGRGLALQVSPGNGAIVAVFGFAPTTIGDYLQRLRPEVARWSRFPGSPTRRHP